MNRLIGSGLAIVALSLAGCADEGGGRQLGSSGGLTGDPGSGDTGGGGGGGSDGDDEGTTGGGAGSSGDTTGDSGWTGTGDGTTGSSGGTGSSGDTETSGGTGSSGGTGGSGDTTTGGTSSGGDTGAVPCQEESATAEPVPPQILFVLDKSGSMMTVWDGVNTRWSSLYQVVDFVAASFEAQIELGAKLFPDFDACGNTLCGCGVDPVEVPVALDNAAAILAGIPGQFATVEGGTPMETGLGISIDYMNTLDPSIPRAMLLVADGEVGGGCTSETFPEALAHVQNAFNSGIYTYAVGIDAVGAAYTQLDQIAAAGGKPNPNGPPAFYQTTNQAELQQAMQDIINDTVSCVVTIDPEPDEPDLFEVWIAGVMVPTVTDCATENGWVWTQQYSEIELCGTACDDLKAAGVVDTKYYCTPG